MTYELLMIFACVYAVAQAAVKAVEIHSKAKYGDASTIAKLESRVTQLEQSDKTINKRDFGDRLAAIEQKLGVRIF